VKANKKEIRAEIRSLQAMKNPRAKIKFDMLDFILTSECKTTMCIAGNVVYRHKGMAALKESIKQSTTLRVAMSILGLPDDKLFFDVTWSGDNRQAYQEAEDRGNHSGMIDAAIAELRRYL
jgi:hypothetical protein